MCKCRTLHLYMLNIEQSNINYLSQFCPVQFFKIKDKICMCIYVSDPYIYMTPTKDRTHTNCEWNVFFSYKPSYHPVHMQERHELCEMLPRNQTPPSVPEYTVNQRNGVREGISSLFNLHTSELYEYIRKEELLFVLLTIMKRGERKDDEKRKEIMHCSLQISLACQGITIQTNKQKK